MFLGGGDNQNISWDNFHLKQTTYTYFDCTIQKTIHIKSYEQSTMIFSWSVVLNCYSFFSNYSIFYQLKSTPKRHKNKLTNLHGENIYKGHSHHKDQCHLMALSIAKIYSISERWIAESEHQWNDSDGGKTIIPWENPSHDHFVHHKSHMEWPGLLWWEVSD